MANRHGGKRIITPDSETSFIDPMITNIARAFRWQTLIDEGKFSNVHELARAIGKDDAYVSRIIRFTLLALPGGSRGADHRGRKSLELRVLL